MGRSLSYAPGQEIKSKQVFTGSTTKPQNQTVDITIKTVDRNRTKLIARTNGYGGNSIYYRMGYFHDGSEIRFITRNSGGSSANGYFRYSADLTEYY